jgi:formate-dependent nitrite reductase membrane component NrfD
MDPKVNGQLQTEWNWLIAVYLFLGGVGAGAYAIAVINGFLGEGLELSTSIGLWISWPALAIGSAALLADLGSPAKAIYAGAKPKTSWIARGFWIISIFMVLSFIHTMLHQFFGAAGTPFVNVLSVVTMIFAVGTMAYTGILLGASKGMPFWNSAIVPVVFVISALVTGHFTIMLGVTLFGAASEVGAELRTMAIEAADFIVLEVLAIAFFLQAAFKRPDSRESAERILAKRQFVVGYFVLGLAAPLVIMLAVVFSSSEVSGTLGLAAVAIGSLLGLIGGLILRQGVLVCGALPTWDMAGFKFRRIARPKDPKPAMGMLPPQ